MPVKISASETPVRIAELSEAHSAAVHQREIKAARSAVFVALFKVVQDAAGLQPHAGTSAIASASFASDPAEAVTKLQTDIAPRYLPGLDRALSDNVDGDGFCGTSLSFIDLQAFAALSFLRDYHEDAFADHPRLHDLVDRIATLPWVVSFVQRRFGLPDAAYVAHCKSIVVGP